MTGKGKVCYGNVKYERGNVMYLLQKKGLIKVWENKKYRWGLDFLGVSRRRVGGLWCGGGECKGRKEVKDGEKDVPRI